MNIMQKPFMKLPKTESFTLNGAGGFFESARASSNHKLLVSCIARHSTLHRPTQHAVFDISPFTLHLLR